jgi:hypothetical protein
LFAPKVTVNRPIPNPSGHQQCNTRPSEGVPCSSAPSEAKQGEKSTVLSTDQEDSCTNIPSVGTQNGTKNVSKQTISAVLLVNSNAQKRYRKQNDGSVMLTSGSYLNEMKEDAAERKNVSLGSLEDKYA